MQNVNWWLMALAFLLGLVLSLALMIRRVKREVPEYATLAAGAAGAGAAGAVAAAKLKGGRGSVDVDADDSATLRVPKVDADADGTADRRGVRQQHRTSDADRRHQAEAPYLAHADRSCAAEPGVVLELGDRIAEVAEQSVTERMARGRRTRVEQQINRRWVDVVALEQGGDCPSRQAVARQLVERQRVLRQRVFDGGDVDVHVSIRVGAVIGRR